MKTNRRNLLKLALVGTTGITTKLVAMPKEKTQCRIMDWSTVVTNGSFVQFAKSVCETLELFLNGDGVRAAYPASVRLHWMYLGEKFPNQHAQFGIDNIAAFTVHITEFEKNDRAGLIRLLSFRWLDTMWSINDCTQHRIAFMRRFMPDYDPDNYKD